MLDQISILYVEDEIDILEEIESFLSLRCAQVYTAENGVEGLKVFKDKQPDLVLTDVTMPEMDGIYMATEIRKLNDEVPIVLMTALSDTQTFVRAIKIGIDGYIGKPVDLDLLEKELIKLSTNIYAKKTLKREQKLLTEYKSAVDEGALVSKTDSKGIITYVNDSFVKISGYTREELIGQQHNIVRHPDTSSELFKEMWKTISAKATWQGRYKNRAKDGSSYHVSATIMPILNENNEIVEFLALRQDVSELEEYREILQKQLEVSSHSLKEKMLLVKEYEDAISMSNAYTRTDTKGIITYVNETFCELTGYTKQELIGGYHNKLRHPDTSTNFYKNMWDTIEAKETWQDVVHNKKKDGTDMYSKTTIVPILNVDGDIVEYMSIHNDITEEINLSTEIISTQREIVHTMGTICETRSKETGNHVKRVAEYSKLLALGYGLEEEEAELIKMASPMHDIGKVAIPDAILNKPGKLTEEEFEIMKNHSALGFEMLKGSDREILKAASTIANEHHEKWNGRGYPNQKKGEEIHIYGRITAIADVFDALGSDRVYKKGWELEAILKLLKDERGEHFDPTLIDVFFKNLDQFLDIRDKYCD